MTRNQLVYDEGLFLRQTREAISAGGVADEVADYIAKLHHTELDGIKARLDAATSESAQAIGEASLRHHMMDALMGTVSREIYRAASLQARSDLATIVLRQLGNLIAAAEDGKVRADEAQEILAMALPTPPFRPYVAAYYTSIDYSHGHFVTEDGSVHQVHPFTGWAQVVTGPNSGMETLQPMFQVDGELRPSSLLWTERGLKFLRFS